MSKIISFYKEFYCKYRWQSLLLWQYRQLSENDQFFWRFYPL